MKIGIISNAAYAVPLLQLLTTNRIQASVFADACSDNDSTAVIRHFCHHTSIPFYEKEPSFLYTWLKEFNPNVVFVLGYKHLIDINQLSSTLLQSVYNIHFGPLPSYRGPNPIFWQIKNNRQTLSVTIHRINDRFDKGPIVWAKDIARGHHLNYGTAHTMLGHIMLEGIIYILQHYAQQKQPNPLPQTLTASNYFRRPILKDVLIDWKEMDGTEIINLILACNPWNKGALTLHQGNEVKILDASLSKEKPKGNTVLTPGVIINIDKCMQVMAKHNKLIDVHMIVLDGAFIPARHAEKYGFQKGQHLGI